MVHYVRATITLELVEEPHTKDRTVTSVSTTDLRVIGYVGDDTALTLRSTENAANKVLDTVRSRAIAGLLSAHPSNTIKD